MNSKPYPEPVQRTLAIAAAKGIPCKVISHEQSGRTTEDAAHALGVDVAAVIKTLVLETDMGFAIAILAGHERLDFRAVVRELNCRSVHLAPASRAAKFSGYQVGGIPPICFQGKCPVLVSQSVLSLALVIGSAGDERHGLRLSPAAFQDLGCRFVCIAKQSAIP